MVGTTGTRPSSSNMVERTALTWRSGRLWRRSYVGNEVAGVVTGGAHSAVSPPRPSTDVVDSRGGYQADQAENFQTGASYGALCGEVGPMPSADHLAKGS